MMTNEKILLHYLRNNARISLTEISKRSGIPLSTVFHTLKRLEKKVIARHVSLLDREQLGYPLQVYFLVASEEKKALITFLVHHPAINTVVRLLQDYDVMAEAYFKNMKELMSFREQLQNFGITHHEEIPIIEELQKESFSVNHEFRLPPEVFRESFPKGY
ncbi:Lrp/AsnC family transcriptional regulator [Candidatus Woesearchaeota archaeon]|nr:Lrp/AsnC family transcriptional regulator [Candidatus Woesearchaeota archaeon]